MIKNITITALAALAIWNQIEIKLLDHRLQQVDDFTRNGANLSTEIDTRQDAEISKLWRLK